MPEVPDRSLYDPVLGCWMHTGQNAHLIAAQMPHGVDVAIDIETPGLDRQFTVNCVTASWDVNGETHSVLFDPCRRPADLARVADGIIAHAGRLILQNAPFDIPTLCHHAMMSLSDIDKVVDTLVLARMAEPDHLVSKKLESLAHRYLEMDNHAEGMKTAFRAAGYRTIAEGYAGMDIGSPIYRFGAMADTVVTLRLEPILRQACRDRNLTHPFEIFGAYHPEEADELIATQETVHRVMLRRSARGINVDTDFLDSYSDTVHVAREEAEAVLASVGLLGGKGKAPALLAHLEANGELPAGWPRTATGKLQAQKTDLERLDHPLAVAQRTLADTEQVLNYLRKVDAQARVTGRCHPQIGTLGASQTGRMSIGLPELQQFSAEARPILISDDGAPIWSIDWSQIEPVVMGCMAGDEILLAPYERGDDLYEPLMRAAGIDRKTAKVCLLATMYGQGSRALAVRIGASDEQTAQIRRQMLAAMPASKKWMAQVQGIATTHGKIVTAGGRILPVDAGGVFRSVNYAVQGSAYDVLAHSICELERLGMADGILIPMHDELVVTGDAEYAAEVDKVMKTPPPFLTAWLGREPVLRTDCQNTGTTWQKV